MKEIKSIKQLYEYIGSDFGKDKSEMQLIIEGYARAKQKGYIREKKNNNMNINNNFNFNQNRQFRGGNNNWRGGRGRGRGGYGNRNNYGNNYNQYGNVYPYGQY